MDLAFFTVYDWFLIVLTVVSVVTAFQNGFVKIGFSISGLTVGVVTAAWIHFVVANWLAPYVVVEISAQILAFLAVVVIAYLTFIAAGEMAKRIGSVKALGVADRLLGAGFGLLRGGLIGAIILMTITSVMPRSFLISGSQLAPYVFAGTHAVAQLMPESLRNQIDPGAPPQAPVPADTVEARATKRR